MIVNRGLGPLSAVARPEAVRRERVTATIVRVGVLSAKTACEPRVAIKRTRTVLLLKAA